MQASTEKTSVPQLNARVLVVEDNDVNQMLARAMLAKLSCSVKVAGNGSEGLQCYKEAGPGAEFDIVLMDCHMPVLDGYQATMAIRELERERGAKRVPIVAVTADVTTGVRDVCRKAGMDDYLSKPYSIEQLGAIMQRWLNA